MGNAQGAPSDVVLDDAPADDASFTADLRVSLQKLLIIARSSDAATQREVAERLANEAVRPERQAQIVECGGLRLLVALTKSDNAEVQRLAAHALANLSALAANQRAIAEADGGLEMLVALLQSPTPEVQRQAAKTLANMSVVPANMRLIAARGGLPPLVALLSAPQAKTRIEAVAAVANLAVDDANEAALVAAGALAPILACLRPMPDDADMLTQCARALRNLTTAPKSAAALRALGGGEQLRALAASGNERVRVQAVAALEKLGRL